MRLSFFLLVVFSYAHGNLIIPKNRDLLNRIRDNNNATFRALRTSISLEDSIMIYLKKDVHYTKKPVELRELFAVVLQKHEKILRFLQKLSPPRRQLARRVSKIMTQFDVNHKQRFTQIVNLLKAAPDMSDGFLEANDDRRIQLFWDMIEKVNIAVNQNEETRKEKNNLHWVDKFVTFL